MVESFFKLMPEVDVVYNVMESTNLTMQKVEHYVKIFQDAVNIVRNSSITDHAKIFLTSSTKEVSDSVRVYVAKKKVTFQVTSECFSCL